MRASVLGSAWTSSIVVADPYTENRDSGAFILIDETTNDTVGAGTIVEPREVKLGVELGEQLEVVQGLAEGDEVVASGQFLVDSEARLRSVLGSMVSAQPAPT